MTTFAVPSRLVAVGSAPEAQFGTPASPVLGWAGSAPTVQVAHSLVPDTGWRQGAAGTFGLQPGPKDAALGLSGTLFTDTIGVPLTGLLGDAASNGAGPPYTWAISLLNNNGLQPPTYTITTDDTVQRLQWPGAMFDSLVISAAADASLAWQGHAVCLQPVSAAPGVTVPDPGLVLPIPGWSGVVTLDNAAEARCLDASVQFTRAVTPKRNTNGVQEPYMLFAGQVEVTGQATVLFEADTYTPLFEAATAIPIDLTWSQGGGAALQKLQVHSSSCALTSVQRLYTADWVQVTLTWRAIATAADAGRTGGLSPVLVTLQNSVPLGSY